jgi:hypothetical protein
MVGTQAPQKLFGDLPANSFPGAVTPNTTVEMPSYVDWDSVQAAQNAQKAQSRASWARAAAANAAGQRQTNQDAEGAKLRSAFDEMYGPQLQNAYNDQMVSQEGQTSAMGVYTPKRQGKTTHPINAWSSNLSVDAGRPGAMPGAFASPGGGDYHTPYRLGEEELRKRLDYMWRMETDPYIRAAGQLGGTMRGEYPTVGGSNPSAWARMVKEREGE